MTVVLGIESSCDETGVAVFHSTRGLLSHAIHSQIAMHEAYGGVVPELASRDHIRRLVPLTRQVLTQAATNLGQIDAIAYTEGPGLAGALLVGASFAASLAAGIGCPLIGIHHLEGHLLSPLLGQNPPRFPFVALLVSGGHTQLMHVRGVGRYEMLGDTLDDAAGEAFDKTAQLLGLPYPGGPALSRLAETGHAGVFKLPRPMLTSGTLDFSFAGLKTAVLTRVKRVTQNNSALDDTERADLAAEFQAAMVDVLVAKCQTALEQTGLDQLVVAGGVGANKQLRAALDAAGTREGFAVFYPELALCTDNGAMIAYAGALRLVRGEGRRDYGFGVRPRWDLSTIA
ncbi:MAG: tRNA (adenosine(37)-N6)-threonylcarbamoyltransferase complex transferase subunit TsaD [Burkholderiales bacterium]